MNMVILFGEVVIQQQLKHKKDIRIIDRTKWNAHTAPLFAMLKLLNLYDIHKL